MKLRKWMLIPLFLVGCGNDCNACLGATSKAVRNITLIKADGTDLCFAITTTGDSGGGVAMVQVDCAKIPVEKLQRQECK